MCCRCFCGLCSKLFGFQHEPRNPILSCSQGCDASILANVLMEVSLVFFAKHIVEFGHHGNHEEPSKRFHVFSHQPSLFCINKVLGARSLKAREPGSGKQIFHHRISLHRL